MHTVVVGLGFGDEGKGGIVDFVAQSPQYGRPRLAVRFNGGLQAGHNVVTGDGRHHTFSQFASCLFVPGTLSILSRFVFVDPFAMQNEADRLAQAGLRDLSARCYASAQCVLVTPYHRTMNRIREIARGAFRHGSCGVGIGEAFRDQNTDLGMQLCDLQSSNLTERLEAQRLARLGEAQALFAQCTKEAQLQLREYMLDLENPGASAYIASRYAAFLASAPATIIEDARITEMISAEPAVFEGAQGFLLDMEHGFFPNVTPARTDARNALEIIGQAGGQAKVVGVLRSYLTRHGEGPFPSETGGPGFPEPHNSSDSFQGRFRQGLFDVPLLDYAAQRSCQLDEIALTHVDAFAHRWPVAVSYAGSPTILPRALFLDCVRVQTEELHPGRMAECVQEWSGRPVSILSRGPRAADKTIAGGKVF